MENSKQHSSSKQKPMHYLKHTFKILHLYPENIFEKLGTDFRGIFSTYITFLCEIKFSGAVFEWCHVVGTLTEGDLDRRPCHHLTRSPEKYQDQIQFQMLSLFHKMNQMKKLQYKLHQNTQVFHWSRISYYLGNIRACTIISRTLVFPELWSPTTTTCKPIRTVTSDCLFIKDCII